MLKTFGSHVRANVVGYVALFIALGGTTYGATGGNFILGQSNTASSATQLSSGAANALRVTSTATNGGRAIGGFSNVGQGVYGHSNQNAGLVGESTNFDGIFGVSHSANASAVSGHNDAGGVGVFGGSPGGYSFGAIGNASQDRASGGWVKAMAFVDPFNHPSDPIRQCFNSQLPASQATSGDCGISYSHQDKGVYDLDFGFQVNDRFISATSAVAAIVASVNEAVNPPKVRVATFSAFYQTFSDQRFWIIVY